MSVMCKYCSQPENKQDNPGVTCESCMSFVHLGCLRRPGTPGDFSCDVFFDFVCEDCSPNKKEVFNRNRFPWVNVILLTLHHLSTTSYGISNHGYFHYKTHICSFIDRHWTLLFGPYFKQKKNWVGTIAGALSVYNQLFFQSGSGDLGETGWWRLLHAFSPAVATHIIQEMAKDKPKGRPRNQLAMDKTLFVAKVTEFGYGELVSNGSEMIDPPSKRRRTEDSVSSIINYYDHYDADQADNRVADEDQSAAELASSLVELSQPGYSDHIFRGFEFTPAGYVPPVPPVSTPPYPSDNYLYPSDLSDSSSVHSYRQSIAYYDSEPESRSDSPYPTHDDDDKIDPNNLKNTKPPRLIVKRETLFSAELNSIDMPWEEPIPPVDKNLVEMTEYEEIQLLKQVEGLIPKAKDPNKKASLHRLKAKLALRRLKRHKHLPIFDLDKTVKLLGGYVTEDPRVAMNNERVLDRFQRSYLLDNLSGTIASTNYGTVLVSPSALAPLRSAYSGVLLKPYIRRDRESHPLWLRITDELLKKTHRNIKKYQPPAHAPIDYSYVQPHHIPALNSLCAQYFWPGIDLTEALQYPEFSCVATYKRLVVGLAFLVPNARANESYISFILVRPGWRRASVATFMLYHLLQTCTGNDVTLHVSPTNPAIFLYQKFGFKVEELVQDFYEKYYDIDYKGCRHALFLRLSR